MGEYQCGTLGLISLTNTIQMSSNYLVGRLYIKECSLPSDIQSKDGFTSNYYTAVKNSPFTIQLGLDNTSTTSISSGDSTPISPHPLTLSNVNIDAVLIYTTEKVYTLVVSG